VRTMLTGIKRRSEAWATERARQGVGLGAGNGARPDTGSRSAAG